MIALLLIGGRSSRMGRDKSLIERPGGRRQIDRMVELARLAGGEVLLSLREPAAPPVDLPVVTDLHPGGGPLAALAAFHARFPHETALVLSCDLFLLDEETVRHLLAAHRPDRQATCFANRLDGLPEPLCAIYEPAALAGVAAWLARGERGARHFLRSLDPLVLDLPRPAALDNANTPRELAECFSKLRHGVKGKTVRILTGETAAESIFTLANTLGGLHEEIRFLRRLPPIDSGLPPLRNGSPAEWQDEITDGDEIGFPQPG